MEDTQSKTLAQSLLKNSSLTDFEITCGSDTYKVHRELLACHSRYFKALFAGEYRESTKCSIELEEDNPNAVKLMVDYFYNFDYEDAHDKATGFSNPLELNAAVYTAADKYDVPDLKDLALKHFARAAPHSAFRHENPVEAIKLAYNGTLPTDRALRNIVLDYWMTFAKLFTGGQGMAIATSIAREVPEFAAEILLRGSDVSVLSYSVTCFANRYTTEHVMREETVEAVFTRECTLCGKPMSEHRYLRVYPRTASWYPFWVKLLD